MLSPEESYGGGDEGDSWKPPHMQQSGGPPHVGFIIKVLKTST